MADARSKQKFHAKWHPRDAEFEDVNLFVLRAESLNVARRPDLSKKWKPKSLDALAVLEVMGPVTYKIELLPSMRRARSVFHVSQLKPYHRS